MNLHAAAAYATHLLKARSTAGHGVHSPFMFRFITGVIGGRTDRAITREIESLRKEMLSDRRVVQVRDLGAGSAIIRDIGRSAVQDAEVGAWELTLLQAESQHGDEQVNRQAESMSGGEQVIRQDAPVQVRERRIRDIAGAAAVPKRGAALLARIAGSLDEIRSGGAETGGISGGKSEAVILELGTSLGISTLALALGAPHRKVISVEGCPELAAIARENLIRHGARNAEVICKEFNEALTDLKNRGVKVALAYIDGNHRGAALTEYVNRIREMGEEMILIADDIHMNRDMICAWKSIAEGTTAPASVAGRGRQTPDRETVPASVTDRGKQAPDRETAQASVTGHGKQTPDRETAQASGAGPERQATTGVTVPASAARAAVQPETGKIAAASLETFRMGMLFCLRNLTPGRYRVRY